MNNANRSPSQDASLGEFDLVDIIAFLWRGRLPILAGLLLGLTAGLSYTYLKKKMPSYASEVAIDVKFPLDMQTSGQTPQPAIEHWNTNIQSQITFKHAYDALSQIAPQNLTSFSFDTALAQQTGAAGDLPKVISFALDDATKHVVVSLNLPFTLPPEALQEWGKTALSLAMPGNDVASEASMADKIEKMNDIPSYDYISMEYELFQRAEHLGINTKSYLESFREQNPSNPAANLLRMIVILEAHKKISREEANSLATKALALIPRLIASAPASSTSSFATYPLGKTDIIRENTKILPSQKRSRLILAGLMVIGVFLGLLVTAIQQFWQSNRLRLKEALT